jgi:quinoprotein glucose dehydrogenase
MRVVAKGPRIQTWVNNQAVEDYTNEALYKTFKKGFIGLQVHSITDREISQTLGPGSGITPRQPLIVKFRNIRARPLH